jgi:hypothetical protein
MIVDREITIKLAPREDGGLRVWSDEVPGLILSHSDQEKIIKDLGVALLAILQYRAAATRRSPQVSGQ